MHPDQALKFVLDIRNHPGQHRTAAAAFIKAMDVRLVAPKPVVIPPRRPVVTSMRELTRLRLTDTR
jgi:hypothetical protein